MAEEPKAEETKAPRKRKPAALKSPKRATNRPVDRPQGSVFEANADGTWGPYERYEEVITNHGRFGIPEGYILTFEEVVTDDEVGYAARFIEPDED